MFEGNNKLKCSLHYRLVRLERYEWRGGLWGIDEYVTQGSHICCSMSTLYMCHIKLNSIYMF